MERMQKVEENLKEKQPRNFRKRYGQGWGKGGRG